MSLFSPIAVPGEPVWGAPVGQGTVVLTPPTTALGAKALTVGPEFHPELRVQTVPAGGSILFYLGDPAAPGNGLHDAATDRAVGPATVTLTIYDAAGAPISALTGLPMSPVVGAFGDYGYTALDAPLSPGVVYHAVALAVYQGITLRVHAKFQLAEYYGTLADPA